MAMAMAMAMAMPMPAISCSAKQCQKSRSSHCRALDSFQRKRMTKGPCARLGGGGSEEGEQKKFITKEQEPQ
ncbi:hypothetical protein KI387_001981, partial [Taxus chinensis]